MGTPLSAEQTYSLVPAHKRSRNICSVHYPALKVVKGQDLEVTKVVKGQDLEVTKVLKKMAKYTLIKGQMRTPL